MTHFGYLEFGLVGWVIWRDSRRPIRFLATKSAFERPIVGAILRSAGQIPVELHGAADAYAAAEAALQSGELIGIFPEAGVDASFTVRALKTGAVRLAQEAGAPLIPIAVWGGQRLLTKRHRIPFRSRFRLPLSFAFGSAVPTDEEAHVATVHLRERLQELLAGLQATYPDDGIGQWWQPRHLGGTAPTPDEAVAADAQAAAARDARRKASTNPPQGRS